MPRSRGNERRQHDGVTLAIRFDRDELGRLDDLCGWMELPREEVIRRALAMLQHGAFIWNAPASWTVGLTPRRVL
jgi:Ribbon-helix-helix protein, copG family